MICYLSGVCLTYDMSDFKNKVKNKCVAKENLQYFIIFYASRLTKNQRQ